MPDPMEELGNFEPGVPVNPIPAAEVRRRGDRLRRRNTLMVVGAAVAVVLVTTPIAVLAGGEGSGKPQPAEPRLTESALLTADEVPARERLTEWRESAEQEGEVLACAPQKNSLTADAETSVRRDFEADIAQGPAGEGPLSVVRTAVLQFDDDAAARNEYDRVQGWILGCPGGDDLAAKGVSQQGVEIENGQGEVRRHDFFAPDICTECDAIRFDHMGVAQFDDRLVMVSFAEVGGPLEPRGLDRTMEDLFAAAITKAGGEIPGTTEPPESSTLDGFPLDSGMPDVSDDSEYRFDPPSIDNEAMIPAGELTACGDSPPETAPLDRLTTRLTGPADSQVRELQLLDDDQEAATHIAHLSELYESCPTSDSGGAPPTFTTTVTEGALGEESLDIRRASDGIGRVAITVVRIGNAVLVENVSDEGEGAEVDALATGARENLADVIAAMNERWGASAGGDPEPSALDVPIDWDLDDEGSVSGPGPKAKGAPEVSPCDRPVWPETGTNRLAVSATIPQLEESRELVVFASADQAVATMAAVRSAIAACPTEINEQDPTDSPEQAWDVLPADTGYDDSVTFSLTYTDGLPGGQIWQLTRVGKAIVAVSTGGEYARGSSAASAAERLTEITAHLTPAMCRYTEAGC